MYSKLKIYYFYTPLPFVMLLVGAFFFQDAIVNTLAKNPHPQINYAIFVLIVTGAIFILTNLRKLMYEGSKLAEFSAALRRGEEQAKLQALAMGYEADVAYVLRMIAATAGRAITHREQVAIEHELAKAESRLNNRHTLPQHITNLLVGMGLLGTFIGLLATLGDIAALISSFATLDVGNANPIEVFRTLVERMKAPMYSMGIAFSASLYGLLGSIILGFMMVSIRRCMQDVVSLLGSEVAQHIEFALARETLENAEDDVQVVAAGGGAGQGSTALVADSAAAPLSAGTALTSQWYHEEIRVLRRIEERLGESSRLQEGALQGEIDSFAKQRGEFIRVVAEHSEVLGHFHAELQRVGVQLGAVMTAMERGNADLRAQLHDYFSDLIQSSNQQGRSLSVAGDLMARMADDSAETRRLMALILDHGVLNDPRTANAELAKMLQVAFHQAVEQIFAKAGAAGPQGNPAGA